MHKIRIIFLSLTVCASAHTQTTPADKALLAKVHALYDTPFRRGLVNFDCAVGFDFEQHLKDTYGTVPAAADPFIKALQPVQYRVFVDQSGAVASPQSKLPDLTAIPHGAEIEESNRNLLQAGLSTWVPYASGTVFPLGPTKYHFEKDPKITEYSLTMKADGLEANLRLDSDLHLLSGVIEQPQHIDITTDFKPGPDGLVLAATSTNTNHQGVARMHYTYQLVDGLQLPSSVAVTSEQNMTWVFHLTDCKVQRGLIVHDLPVKPKL